MIGKLAWFYRYWRIFGNVTDVMRYRALRCVTTRSDAPVALRVRAAANATLYIRPGTTDATVFWDAFVAQWHQPPVRLPDHATILDLGANVGFTMAHLAAANPTARVIGVEMDAGNAAMAARNLHHFGRRCEVVHAAVWETDGEVRYSGDAEWGYRVAADGAGTQDMAVVRCLMMDTLLTEQRIDRVDFLKMDIEGAEAAILTENATWLTRVDSLVMEVHPPATQASCTAALTRFGIKCSADPRRPNLLSGVRQDVSTAG